MVTVDILWLKVTTIRGNAIVLNAHQIVMMADSKRGTMVTTTNGRVVVVKETTDNIQATMMESLRVRGGIGYVPS